MPGRINPSAYFSGRVNNDRVTLSSLLVSFNSYHPLTSIYRSLSTLNIHPIRDPTLIGDTLNSWITQPVNHSELYLTPVDLISAANFLFKPSSSDVSEIPGVSCVSTLFGETSFAAQLRQHLSDRPGTSTLLTASGISKHVE